MEQGKIAGIGRPDGSLVNDVIFERVKAMSQTAIVKEIMDHVVQLPYNKKVKLLNLIREWETGEMRDHMRKPVSVPIQFVSDDKLFKEVTQDISCGGTFVSMRKQRKFEINQKIAIVFSLSDKGRAFKLKGRVARIEQDGIGIQFEEITPYLATLLEEELFEKAN